ncbi:MAG: CBS domain-containing protein [Bacteroidia bacterium]|jgi:CBS domain-containing protein
MPMGQDLATSQVSKETRIQFIRHLLNDIEALDKMIEQGMIESGVTRIGAEQEFCLVNSQWRPAQNAQEILPLLNDHHFTTELARYNLEINLDPIELVGNCFTTVETQLRNFLSKAKDVCDSKDTNVLLTGILPTISKTELQFDYMTQSPRYWSMNQLIKESRGSDIELKIRGVDELSVVHDSVLFEACNTSFQLHLQVDPKDFTSSYNWSQAISGPVLSMCTNSPILLGRELWSETRIALFQQSIDTRNASYALKNQEARVSFGNQWSKGTAADIYKNDIATHKILLARDVESDSLKELEEGRIPALEALCLNNSTIYRWNRPCYGVGGGKPHLRIENRYIASGPTVIDEMANFAFWVGLMLGRPAKYDNIQSQMDFRDAKANFIKAARNGKESMLLWDGELRSAQDLTVNTLLPMAYEGLQKANVDSADSTRLLDIIEGRAKGQTGSQWSVKQFRALKKTLKTDEALVGLTKNMFKMQQSGLPCHEWDTNQTFHLSNKDAFRVGHIMSTKVFRVNHNDHADLATSIMEWKNIHHVPVEDGSSNISGLLTWTHMKRHKENQGDHLLLVEDIMTKKVTSIPPEMDIAEAIRIMKKHEFGCLPVVRGTQMVGIITIKDVLPFDQINSQK